MSETLIIGYGNPLRGDDGLGWHAAIRLSQDLHEPDVEVLACQQLTPELAEPISRASRVLFIDATHGRTAGEVSCHRVEAKSGSVSLLKHHVHPATLLGYAKSIFGAEPEGTVFSVVGRSFDYGLKMSQAATQALAQIEPRVRKWIHQKRDEQEPPHA